MHLKEQFRKETALFILEAPLLQKLRKTNRHEKQQRLSAAPCSWWLQENAGAEKQREPHSQQKAFRQENAEREKRLRSELASQSV